MKDVYMYIIPGGALPEFADSLDVPEGFKEYGYRLPCSEKKSHLKPPPNSNVFIIGDNKTLQDTAGCTVKELKDNGCKVIMYYHELTPMLTYDNIEYWTNPNDVWGKAALGSIQKVVENIDNYHKVMFLGDWAVNYFTTKYPEHSDKAKPGYYYLGTGKGWKLKTVNNPKYDFFHFAWVQEQSWRKEVLTELSKEFSIYPKWGDIYGADRTRAFEESKYLLFLVFIKYPYFSWLRYNFSVMNNMPMFTEKVVCEPLYDRSGSPSFIVPNKHYIEIPFDNVEGIKKALRWWLDRPEEIEKVKENLKEFLKEEWSVPYRLCKLFDEVF